MRILHITPHYYPAMGGAEVMMKEISERLASRGHAVTVLAMKSWGAGGVETRSGPLKDREVINQVTVNRFTPADRIQHLFNGFLGVRGAHRLLGLAMGPGAIQMLAAGPFSLRPLYDSLRSKPEVVTVSNWYCGSLVIQALQARRFRNFALVGIPLFHTEHQWSHSTLHASMLDRCDAVVAMTEHERRFIGQRSTRDNAHVIGVGVDPSVFAHADGSQIRARFGIGDAPLVGYVGRMSATKGVATLIRAMRRVWRTDATVRLLLAGPGLNMTTDPSPEDEVSRELAGLSDAERSRVVVIGRFSDLEKASIFAALDLFAMPSVGESFGIAYLEAWMCGKAVIGSRIGSTQCVIEDGVDGLLVSPWDPDDLARSILGLLSNRSRREQMGRMGREKTRARFSWDAIADKTERVYHDARRDMLLQ